MRIPEFKSWSGVWSGKLGKGGGLVEGCVWLRDGLEGQGKKIPTS